MSERSPSEWRIDGPVPLAILLEMSQTLSAAGTLKRCSSARAEQVTHVPGVCLRTAREDSCRYGGHSRTRSESDLYASANGDVGDPVR